MKTLLFILLCVFNLSSANAMSKEEALHRCQVRLGDLDKQIAGVVSTDHRSVIEKGIQDTKKIISQLEQSNDSTELYRLSSACHDALFALEWIAHQYGTHQSSAGSSLDSEKMDAPAMMPTNIALKKQVDTKQEAGPKKMVKPIKAFKAVKKVKAVKKKLTSKKSVKKNHRHKAKKKTKNKKTKRSLKTA